MFIQRHSWDDFYIVESIRIALSIVVQKKLKDLLEWTHKEEAMLSLTATYDEFESLITKQHSYELFETIIEKKKEGITKDIYRCS